MLAKITVMARVITCFFWLGGRMAFSLFLSRRSALANPFDQMVVKEYRRDETHSLHVVTFAEALSRFRVATISKRITSGPNELLSDELDAILTKSGG